MKGKTDSYPHTDWDKYCPKTGFAPVQEQLSGLKPEVAPHWTHPVPSHLGAVINKLLFNSGKESTMHQHTQNSSAANWLTCWWTSQGLVLCPKSAAVIMAAWTNSRWWGDCKNSSPAELWACRASWAISEAWRKWRARSVARMQCSMTARVSAYSSYKKISCQVNTTLD